MAMAQAMAMAMAMAQAQAMSKKKTIAQMVPCTDKAIKSIEGAKNVKAE